MVGDEAPNFFGQTQNGPFGFYEHTDTYWCVFFSHPADYTPVCTSEMVEAQKLYKEFKDRKCRVVGLSVDPEHTHEAWLTAIKKLHGVRIQFPIVSDPTGKIARQFGMIHPGADDTEASRLPIRAVLIIDAEKRIQAQMNYPPSTGRNFNEILRMLDALQAADEHEVATPANWTTGEDIMVLPSMTDQEAEEKFPKGFVTIKPFLRLAPQPGF